jgi:hypothetical protein
MCRLVPGDIQLSSQTISSLIDFPTCFLLGFQLLLQPLLCCLRILHLLLRLPQLPSQILQKKKTPATYTNISKCKKACQGTEAATPGHPKAHHS